MGTTPRRVSLSIFRGWGGTVSVAALALSAWGMGCVGEVADESEDFAHEVDEDEELEPLAPDNIQVGSDELVVTERTPAGDYTVYGASLRSCSTASVSPLVDQLVDEMNCANPEAMARIDNIAGIQLAKGASPYLQGAAARALRSAAAVSPGLRVNSSLRALPQQYMLYRWSLRGRCGVPLAAKPGRSKHESGLALDVSNWKERRAPLEKRGFDWFGVGDRVHFTFRGPGAKAVSGESTIAFKRLWNRNHPGDRLPETDVYDRETELRLKVSPSNGFVRGASCKSKI